MQWSGSTPPDPTNWDTITYTYDPAGRRITKNVDGYPTRYVYDGGHVIAEYDDSGLLRKYIYGPCVDEPVCMIDEADNNKTYYYHYDALGSVVALSDSNGDSCQSYEYSAYGQVAASDPNFIANPYMFTGRRFDIETGLYYYRARYYNPHIGRFMQTDPVGYDDGINWYLYCRNNPLNRTDPSGLETFYEPESGKGEKQSGDYYSATGRILVLPSAYFPSPSDITSLEEGWDDVESITAVGDLITIAKITASYALGDTAATAVYVSELIYNNTVVSAELDAVKDKLHDYFMNSIGGYAYSAFFEVNIEDKVTGEQGTRWVGVKGIGNNDFLGMGDNVYLTYEEAWIAGVTGASNYINWLNGLGDSDIYYGWFEYTGDAMSDEDGTEIPL